MKGNRDQEIKEILEAALSSYSAETPRPGFEQRVLNRVKYDVRQPRASWLRPALIVLASACLLLVIVSLPALRKPAANPSIAVAGTKRFQALPSIAATVPLKVSEPSKPSRKRPGTEKLADRQRSLPKLATFPSPAPLTTEEHALLVLATSRPQDVPKLLVRNSNPDEQSIQIEPITIKPL
jgi:hypothetical protein